MRAGLQVGETSEVESQGPAGMTQRCPVCQRLNRVPAHDAGKARCGACGALLPQGAAATSAPGGGDMRREVIERWDALVRLVPRGRALDRATGRSGLDDPAADPVGWLSMASRIPRDDLDQVRLLRIHLASNKVVPHNVLTKALDTLHQAGAAVRRSLPG